MEPSEWARAKAFNVVTSHGDCLLDDYPMDDLMLEIATVLDQARELGAQDNNAFIQDHPGSYAHWLAGRKPKS